MKCVVIVPLLKIESSKKFILSIARMNKKKCFFFCECSTILKMIKLYI